jgi:hypothetical protein
MDLVSFNALFDGVPFMWTRQPAQLRGCS